LRQYGVSCANLSDWHEATPASKALRFQGFRRAL
jgi:hypothetical protein